MGKFHFDAARRVRIAFAMVAAIVMLVAPAEAASKHRKHVVHFRRTHAAVRMAQAAAPPAPTLGPMRYYGGPKSPMWREVR